MSDSADFYAILGVCQTAGASEIKNAYRALAKEHHPDNTSSKNDARIKAVNEAYSVLRDPKRRAQYDRELAESESVSNFERIDPLVCCDCGKITIQPRYLIFWRVFSLILFTNRTPVQGIYCAPCAKTESMKSTLFTSLFGWWGIPWGPVWTLSNGFQNAMGGTQPDHVNDALAWRNVIALIQLDRIPLAYAAAEGLLNSSEEQIARAAEDFTSLCRANGFKPSRKLNNSWAQNRIQVPLRLFVLLILPLALTGWLLIDSSSPYSPGPSVYANPGYEAAASAQSDSPGSGDDDDAQVAEEAVIATCEALPENGTLLNGSENLRGEGHRLEIDNGSRGDAIVKVRDASTRSVVASLFVEKGRNARIDGIPDGSYVTQYAMGEQLDESCDMFVGDYTVAEFREIEEFRSEYVDDYRGVGYIYQVLSFTLYTVPGGNVRPQSIDPSDFVAK